MSNMNSAQHLRRLADQLEPMAQTKTLDWQVKDVTRKDARKYHGVMSKVCIGTAKCRIPYGWRFFQMFVTLEPWPRRYAVKTWTEEGCPDCLTIGHPEQMAETYTLKEAAAIATTYAGMDAALCQITMRMHADFLDKQNAAAYYDRLP